MRTAMMANAITPPTAAPTMAPVENPPTGSYSEEAVAELVSVVTTVADLDEGTRVDISVDDDETLGIGVLEGALSVTMSVCLVMVTRSLLGIVWVVPESVMMND